MTFFIDLEKLKITKTYNYLTKVIEPTQEIDLHTISLFDFAAIFQAETVKVLETLDSNTETCFLYRFNTADEKADEEEVELFISAINAIVGVFLRSIIMPDQGRPRERRLGIPEAFNCINASKGLLRETINHKTLIDRFNIKIVYKDLKYILVSDKTIIEQDFIHSTDELEIDIERLN